MLQAVRRTATQAKNTVVAALPRAAVAAAPARALTQSTGVAAAAKPTSTVRWLSLAVAGSLGVLMASQLSTQSSAAPAKSGLDEKNFVPLKLIKREKYNHNTDLFTFALPNESADLDLPVSSFFLTKTKGADGKDVIRPYTPIDQFSKGHMTLLVKVYPQGVMSKHIHSLKEGDSLEIKGPMKKLAYEPNKYKQVGMIAGGTGITPMLQVIEKILSNPNDKTRVSLVFANTTPSDILLRGKLDALARSHPQQVQITYVVDQADKSWKGPTGYLTKDLLKDKLPKPADDSFIYTCGPPGFMTLVSGNKNMKDFSQGELTGLLKEMGYTEKNVFKV